MIRIFFSTTALLLCLFSYSQADRIIGYWLDEAGEGQIVIFKTPDGKYNGKIIWLIESKRNKKDEENPDEKLRNRSIMGLNIMNGLTWDADAKEWTSGVIYDPKSGNTYDSYAWFEDGNYEVLHLKGFVMGMRFIGRTTMWKREKEKRKE